MAIDFDSETIEITNKLKQVEGYLDCEKIIVHNIKNRLTMALMMKILSCI